jgi:hypothetical protein
MPDDVSFLQDTIEHYKGTVESLQCICKDLNRDKQRLYDEIDQLKRECAKLQQIVYAHEYQEQPDTHYLALAEGAQKNLSELIELYKTSYTYVHPPDDSYTSDDDKDKDPLVDANITCQTTPTAATDGDDDADKALSVTPTPTPTAAKNTTTDEMLNNIFAIIDDFKSKNDNPRRSFPNSAYFKEHGVTQHYLNKYTINNIKALYNNNNNTKQ